MWRKRCEVGARTLSTAFIFTVRLAIVGLLALVLLGLDAWRGVRWIVSYTLASNGRAPESYR